jgi:hypothetical protein
LISTAEQRDAAAAEAAATRAANLQKRRGTWCYHLVIVCHSYTFGFLSMSSRLFAISIQHAAREAEEAAAKAAAAAAASEARATAQAIAAAKRMTEQEER